MSPRTSRKHVTSRSMALGFQDKSRLSHLQVSVQLAGVALCCWPVGLLNQGSAGWLLLCLAGAAAGIWTLFHNRMGNFGIYPEPRPGAELITSGPYQWVRHPMYSALILMMIGVTGYNGHGLNAGGLVLVAVAVVTKAGREERFLMERFRGYRAYAAATRRFIPGVY